MSSSRTVQTMSRMCSLCRQISKIRSLSSTSTGKCDSLLSFKPQLLTSVRNLTVSQDPSVDVSDYPAEVEVSYDEFKYVDKLLPKTTVPEVPDHPSYPTPSGWMPPNDEIRSQQPYLVQRTKNHVLPVYPKEREVWGRIMHHVIIKNIDGDIWKLEAELRGHLQGTTQAGKIITQVHEVSRCIRIRGQHRAAIAQFLLDKGM